MNKNTLVCKLTDLKVMMEKKKLKIEKVGR